MAISQSRGVRADPQSQAWRPPSGASRPYNALLEQTPADLAALRHQQAQFADVRRRFDDGHWGMVFMPLAPAAGVMLAEGGAALAATALLKRGLKPGPLVLTKKSWINGNTDAARAGQRAHAALRAKVEAKPGWKYEKQTANKAGRFKPDVTAPKRSHQEEGPYQMEMKPNTPSGRKAAARAVKRYETGTSNKTRAIFYDPDDYLE